MTQGASRGAGLLALLACLVVLTACQSPFLVLGGGELTGEEVSVESFAFASDYRFFQLEVRPEDPYSVNLRVLMVDGRFLIDAGKHRRWHDYMKEEPRVRIRLGGVIYPALAVRVDDEELIAQFSKRRTIYELVPR